MKSAVECLAQIRLSTSRVEQFLAIACSLADDNPAIKGQVHEAAKEARSAALLVDHLRNLFSHQQSIEFQQELSSCGVGGAGWHLAAAAATEAASEAGLRRQHFECSVGGRIKQQQQPDSQFLFTYSNQLTLYKAAKCLVANVAKILFLTDSIVLSQQQQQQLLLLPSRTTTTTTTTAAAATSQVSRSDQQQQQQYLDLSKQQQQHAQAADRLDNVANYSQLLRCFGELSADLVDLGLCIMVGSHSANQQHQQQQRPLSCSSESRLIKDTQCSGGAANNADRAGQFRGQRGHPNESRAQSHTLSTLMVVASPPATEAAPATPTTPTTPAAAAAPTTRPLEGDCSTGWRKVKKLKGDQLNHLENQIQDMQTLFQVNRLIIERSILLLLSTSKCCLRRGADCLRSLEARQSIVVQIRASISIIMAIVKCSVFAAGTSSSTIQAINFNSGGDSGGDYLLQQQPNRGGLISRDQSGQRQGANLFAPTAAAAAFDWRTAGQADQLQRQQLDYYRYLAAACQSPLEAPANFAHSPLNNRPFQHRQQQQPQLQPVNPNPASNDFLLGESRPQQQPQPEPPLQIMNYFLQTWNGTQSAHDAINKLQSLVKPISQVTNFKCLAALLDGIFATHFRHQQQQQQRQRQQQKQSSDSSSAGQLFAWAHRYTTDLLLSDSDAIAGQLNPSSMSYDDNDKENHQQQRHQFGPIPSVDPSSSSSSLLMNSNPKHEFMFMDKRLLISTLNGLFLDEVKINLIERAHEFTDCAYTKHEHREDILQLLQCVRFQLNKLVKILYKCRKKASLGMSEIHLDQLRQVASHIDESCDELKYESNAQFLEQSEQLIEICKMLNQIAPTNKMKITTKTLAIWFELNIRQLLEIVGCFCENPRSKELKDCTWAYLQVWCSFYDDFCQLARQVAYLTHSQFDSDRSARVAGWRDQVMMRMHQQDAEMSAAAAGQATTTTTTARRTTSNESSIYGDIDLGQATSRGGELIDTGGPQSSPACNSLLMLMPDVSRGGRFIGRPIQQQRQQQLMLPQHQWTDQQHGSSAHHHQTRLAAASEANQQLRAQSARELELSHASSVEQPLNIMHHHPPYPHNHHNHHHHHQLQLHEQQYHQQHQQQRQPRRVGGGGMFEPETAFNCGGCDGCDPTCGGGGGATDSPRSLDHYYGFGANYHRRAHVHPASLQSHQQQQQQPPLPPSRDYGLVSSSGRGEHDYRHQLVSTDDDDFCSGDLLRAAPPPPPRAALSYQPDHLQQQQHHHHLQQQQQHHYSHAHVAAAQQQQQQHQYPAQATNYAQQQRQQQQQRLAPLEGSVIRPPQVAPRRVVTIDESHRVLDEGRPPANLDNHHERQRHHHHQQQQQLSSSRHRSSSSGGGGGRVQNARHSSSSGERTLTELPETSDPEASEPEQLADNGQLESDQLELNASAAAAANSGSTDQQSSSTTEPDKWSDSDADAIVRGAKETAQMALSMYQFTKGEGDLNTTQDLFTQAELFAEEANELYKEVRCFSYKVPAGDLKKELLAELGTIPALVQQLQFIVKNPTVGKPATFAKVDSVIRETKLLMEAVNRVVTATLSCRQHYNMAIASMRKRTRTLSPSYRADKGLEFENHSSNRQSTIGSRHGAGGGGMGSEPDI